MRKIPITAYLDFSTAAALRVSADTLGVSQSRWLNLCIKRALDQPTDDVRTPTNRTVP